MEVSCQFCWFFGSVMEVSCEFCQFLGSFMCCKPSSRCCEPSSRSRHMAGFRPEWVDIGELRPEWVDIAELWRGMG